MSDGMAIAALSMGNDMQRLSSISNNLANTLTPGYKRELSFAAMLSGLVVGNTGSPWVAPVPGLMTKLDLQTGTLQMTGNPLDLAIETPGFFEVQKAGQTFYTRQGNFSLDSTGQLITANGEIVQGLGGNLQLSSAQATIDRTGKIRENDKLIGQIKIVHFIDPHLLQAVGNGKFLQAAATIKNDGLTALRQGYLEASNVNSASEMIKMIETMRHFETGQKIIQMYDDMNERALSKLGEF